MTESKPEPELSRRNDSVTLAHFVDDLEPQVAKWVAPLARFAQDGVLQTEGELRRGLVTMNGAGLIAVISLLSQSLGPTAVRGAAVVYLLGLGFGCVGWLLRERSLRTIWLAEVSFATVFLTLRADPAFKTPLTTAEEIDAVVKSFHGEIDKVSKKLKEPGKTVRFWSYLALGFFFFFFSTTILVGDFVLAPQHVARDAKSAAVSLAAPRSVPIEAPARR